jgi:hypothetical protein
VRLDKDSGRARRPVLAARKVHFEIGAGEDHAAVQRERHGQRLAPNMTLTAQPMLWPSYFFLRAAAARSDSIRPAIERIWAGVAFPFESAPPAMLAVRLLGGFSGVVLRVRITSPFRARGPFQ